MIGAPMENDPEDDKGFEECSAIIKSEPDADAGETKGELTASFLQIDLLNRLLPPGYRFSRIDKRHHLPGLIPEHMLYTSSV